MGRWGRSGKGERGKGGKVRNVANDIKKKKNFLEMRHEKLARTHPRLARLMASFLKPESRCRGTRKKDDRSIDNFDLFSDSIVDWYLPLPMIKFFDDFVNFLLFRLLS